MTTVRIDWDGPDEEPLRIYGRFDRDGSLWSVEVHEVVDKRRAGVRPTEQRRYDLEETLAEDEDVRLELAVMYDETIEAMAEDEAERRREEGCP